MLSLIAAMDCNRLIGDHNALPWYLPADLKRFKEITLGKPIIMGRKTYESIGKPLPGRQNIIISRNPSYTVPSCQVFPSLSLAYEAVADNPEIMIIGGGKIYEQAIEDVGRMYLTIIEHAFEGDAWFPQYDSVEWHCVNDEQHQHQTDELTFSYRFVILERKK